jgi:hypothetical protein
VGRAKLLEFAGYATEETRFLLILGFSCLGCIFGVGRLHFVVFTLHIILLQIFSFYHGVLGLLDQASQVLDPLHQDPEDLCGRQFHFFTSKIRKPGMILWKFGSHFESVAIIESLFDFFLRLSGNVLDEFVPQNILKLWVGKLLLLYH